MKRVGEIAIWLAAGLVLSAGARADDVASADNPYIPIVTRNIFALNPPDTNALSDVDPPPKITLKGIMSANGNSQALYTVAGTGKPGQPAKDQSYILGEGQGQDDVEVTHINSKASLVTFNNHGTMQDIPLANAPTGNTSAPGRGGSFGGPGLPRPATTFYGGNGGNSVGSSSGRGGTAGQNRGMGNNANQNPDSPVLGGGMTVQSLQSTPSSSRIYNPQQQQDNLTAQQRAALIEIQRQAYQNDPNPANQRFANLLPPTPFMAPKDSGSPGNP